MTDQAIEQSGTANAAEPDLAALMKQAITASEPKGQPAAVDGEDSQEGAGASPEVDAADSAAAMFKVPALEGDGFEELTADDLKAQRLMHKDYTQKTQAIAEERKRVEALKAEATQAATARLEKLDYDLQAAAQLIQSFEQNVNWQALRELDPAEFVRQKEAQSQRIHAWEQARNHAEAIKGEQRKSRRAEEAQRLVEAIPEWLDPNRARAEASKIVEGAAQYGLTPQDIDGFDDHRMILVLRDALAHRELKAKGATVKAEVAKAPPLAKPGTTQQGNPKALATHRTVQAARKDGTQDSLAKAMTALFR